MGQLWESGASELAAMIRAKQVSSVEVIEAHLARIDAVNPAVNAVTEVLADQALAAARGADQMVAAGHPLGRLHGVPFTIKHNLDLAGSPTTQGVPALAEAVPPVDAPVVERMKAAGAVPLARTNLPDMGLRVHTESGLFGLTRNPWDPGRTAGGSSGGEAAALATGMSPIGLGNDIGGSLRNPATHCAVASLKPSAGVVPSCTLIPASEGPASFQLMPVDGPMARHVADVRLGLDVLAGRHPRDPYSVPVGPIPPLPDDRPVRVALLAEPPGGSTDPAIAARVRAVGEALAAAGYDVVEAEPPRLVEVFDTWFEFIGADLQTMSPMIHPLLSDDANRFLDNLLEGRPPVDLAEYTRIMMARQALMRDWSVWFVEHDVLVTPTWTQLPFEHGFDIASVQSSLDTIEMIRCVTPANVLGLPSACVPAGDVDGLPVGVLVNADRFRDHLTLDVAQAIEDALGTSTPIDPRT
jgi:amidase